jgi:hypothetical protein
VPPPTRARDLLAGAVVLMLTVSVARLVVDHELLRHAASLRRHRANPDTDLPVIEHVRTLVKGGVWLGRVGIAVTVVMWMSRARRIVQGYDCMMFRSDPDFAVSGWFIPPINLVAPYLLMADVVVASDPARRPEAIIDKLPVPKRVFWWWALFVISGIAGFMELNDLVHGGLPWASFNVHLDYVMTLCQIASAALLLWIVVGTTAFLQQRHDSPVVTG